MQEEYQEIEASQPISLGEDPKCRHWKKRLIDKVNDKSRTGKIRLEPDKIK